MALETDWLLRARIQPPAHGLALIERAALLRWLARQTAAHALVFDAPPGYGKSVALSQWRNQRLLAGDAVAWLTLDAMDEPDDVLAYLAFSLREADALGRPRASAGHAAIAAAAAIGLHAPEAASLTPQAARARWLQALLAAIEAHGQRVWLLLDDCDHAQSEVQREILSPLARLMPHNLRLAVAQRKPLDIGLARLRGRMLVCDVGAEQLRMSLTETRQALRAWDSCANPQQVQQRTAGWPALLPLARSALGATLLAPSAAGSPRSTAGGAREALAQLAETHLLPHMDASVREAARLLSVLPVATVPLLAQLMPAWLSAMHGPSVPAELNPSAVDACWAEATLARLRWLGVLASAASSDTAAPQALVMPPLFRACFSHDVPTERMLRWREPAALALLHGGWLTEAVELAAQQAHASGDVSLLLRVFPACDALTGWFMQGLHFLLALTEPLMREWTMVHPRLGYPMVMSLVKRGRITEAQEHIDALQARRSTLQGSHADMADLDCDAEQAVAVAIFTANTQVPDPAQVRHILALADRGGRHARLLRYVAHSMQAQICQDIGRLDASQQASEAMLVAAIALEAPSLVLYSRLELAALAMVRGHVAEAERLHAERIEGQQASLRADNRLAPVRDVLRAELLHEVQPQQAVLHCAHLQNICRRLPQLDGWSDIYSAALRTASEQMWLAGDLPGALALLAVGAEQLLQQGLSGAARVAALQRVMLLALHGQARQAAVAWDDAQCLPGAANAATAEASASAAPGTSTQTPWREREAWAEACAALALADVGVTAPRDVCVEPMQRGLDVVERECERAVRDGHVRMASRLGCWLNVLHRAGLEPQAALDATGPYGRTQSLLRAAPLLQRGAASPGQQLDSTPAERSAVGAQPTGFFSPREAEVMALVASGLRDKAIAQALGVTVHGVRFHVRKIYAKLNIRKRREVRARAEALGVWREPAARGGRAAKEDAAKQPKTN